MTQPLTCVKKFLRIDFNCSGDRSSSVASVYVRLSLRKLRIEWDLKVHSMLSVAHLKRLC